MADAPDARQLRRQRVHTEVRAVAVAMMTERGFDGVTVEEIAAGTTVSPSTIYRHFGTKEALVLTPGRPLQVVERLAGDTKRSDRAAIRRAVNKVYGKDAVAADEVRLAVGNPALREQFDREWAAAGGALAEAFASRQGGSVGPGQRAIGAAVAAVVAAAICDWAAAPASKLTAHLDTALAAIAFSDGG